MSMAKKDGAVVLRLEKPLVRVHAEEHAAAIAAAIEEAGAGGVVRVEIPFPEGPDAGGLAVLMAASGECRAQSVELRVGLPLELSEFAEDLRLSKLAAIEPLEVVP